QLPHPPHSSLFPYTTLFRSPLVVFCVNVRQRSKPHNQGPGSAVRAANEVALFPGGYTPGGCGRCRQLKTALCIANTAGRLPLNRSEEHTSELQSRENLVCRL